LACGCHYQKHLKQNITCAQNSSDVLEMTLPLIKLCRLQAVQAAASGVTDGGTGVRVAPPPGWLNVKNTPPVGFLVFF